MTTKAAAPTEKATPQPRSPQDKKLVGDLALAEQMLQAALHDEEAAPLLAEGSYTPAELKAGLALQKAVMQAYIARQEADEQQLAATRSFVAADKAARTLYTQLRDFARSAFVNDTAAREALGLSGVEPKDPQKFVAAATALIDQGKNELYATKLAKKTVTSTKLAELATRLEAWKDAERKQAKANNDVSTAAAKCDAAAKALFDWLAEYQQFARAQFKDQPGIKRRLWL